MILSLRQSSDLKGLFMFYFFLWVLYFIFRNNQAYIYWATFFDCDRFGVRQQHCSWVLSTWYRLGQKHEGIKVWSSKLSVCYRPDGLPREEWVCIIGEAVKSTILHRQDFNFICPSDWNQGAYLSYEVDSQMTEGAWPNSCLFSISFHCTSSSEGRRKESGDTFSVICWCC